jgi:hypothetical protein
VSKIVPKLSMMKVEEIHKFIVNNINNEDKKKGAVKEEKFKKI